MRDAGRLAALQASGILDTPAEQPFDDLARLAEQVCHTPVALICLLGADRPFFKACRGIDPRQLPPEISFYDAVLESPDLVVVPDLSADRRPLRRNRPAAPASRVRFYAAAPLRTAEGHTFGALCVLDREPRPGGLTEAQATSLAALARQVMAQIESRRGLAERNRVVSARDRMIAQQAALIETQDTLAGAKGDLDVIFEALVAGAMRAIEAADGGVVELLQNGCLVHRWARGTLKPHTGLEVPLVGSLAGTCFLTNKPILCADALADDRTTPGLVQRLGTRSCLLVPVSRNRKVIGVLKLQSGAAGAFTDHDLQVVRLFAGAAAAGVADASAAASRRAARTAEDRYRAVFDSAIDFAIIVMDMNGLVIDWNEGAARTLGWSREEIIGLPADVFFTPEDCAAGVPRREMNSALIDGRGTDERWHLRKGGARFWANGEMMTLRSNDGKSIGFLKILRDRTAQHEAAVRIMASERRLRLERGLLQAVLQQAPVGINIAFADGQAPLVNACMLAMTDAPAPLGDHEPASGERRARRRDAIDEALTRALRRGEALSNEVIRRENPADGELHHWALSTTPVRGDDDQVLAAVTIVVDVEEQRRALRALEASEERLALAIEASGSIGWWDWDVRRDLVFASATFASAYGVDAAAAAKGLPMAVFAGRIHPEDRERVQARTEAALAAGGEFGEEYRIYADGQPMWVYARGRCYLDGDGKAARFPGVTVDVTARKAIEAAVEAKQAELRTVIEAVPVGILLAEAPTGRITMGNRGIGQILGHPAYLSPDRAAYDAYVAFHEDGRRVRAEEWPLARITAGECTQAQLDARYQQPDGRQIWIAVSGEAIRDAAGNTVGAVAAVVDIEDRKQAEANQAILNHEISHRMKNTLAMVQAVATQTLRNAGDLPAAREALDNRLSALGKAHDILLLGKAESAGVAAVIESAMTSHDDRQGRIATSGPGLPIAPSAALSLALIVHELATNAVKYGGLSVPGGRVAVTWSVSLGSEGEIFTLRWRESGGPLVAPPARKGFGSRLIERGFGAGPGCAVSLSYLPDGVTCFLTVPLSRIQARDERS